VAVLTREVAQGALAYADRWLAFRQTYLRVPGVQAAVLLDDEMLLSRAYGSADVEAGVPLTTDHLFRVASHSKTFTATAVLQLVEAGRLRLDDPVGRWLPFLEEEPVSPIAGVALRELLSHSGGLVRDGHDADFWQLMYAFPDETRLRAIARDAADVRPPNERFKYSNIAFGLLGMVVEAASGTTYHEHVTTEVVQRLGLSNTGPELDPRRAGDYAVGYSSLAYAPARVPIPHVDTRALAAATGFYSTAEDLCRYAAAHFWGVETLVSDASKRLLQHQEWQVEGVADNAYGLGFGIVTAGGRRLVGHSGGYPGHITRTVFDPDDRLAVSVLTNAIDGPAEPLALAIVKVLDLAARQEPDPEAQRQGGDRFAVRLANLWGVRDVALLGGRVLLLDPTAPDPTEVVTELAVEGAATLRVVKGPGYSSVGESLEYVFASDGGVESVHGPGGLTWWPLSGYHPPTATLGG
jgi:CubicO group peptidase (beta-lactamase class C family)